MRKLLNNKGFNLVEITIIVGVMAVMSTTSFSAYTKAKQIDDVFAAAYQLASDIRTAQNYALGGKQNAAGDAIGWGIYFDAQTANEKYSICYMTALNSGLETGSCKTEDLKLKKLKIEDVKIDSGTADDTTQIIFRAPDPKIYINDGETASFPGSGKELVLKIKSNTGSSAEKTITLNKFGLIEVK